MTIRRVAVFALAALLFASTVAPADDAKLPDVKAFDKVVIDSLRAVHNKGADLYNEGKDFAGAYRVYQGALITVRPLLAHRPEAQKIIDTGFESADKDADVAHKAFLLHETIENVRKNLRVAISDKKLDEPKKPDEPKKVEPPVKKPEEPKKSGLPVAPLPKEVEKKPVGKNPDPVPGRLDGLVTLKGKPLAAGELSLVSRDQPVPKVYKAAIKADGTYTIAEKVPPGKYTLTVTGKDVPDKYGQASTSGVVVEVVADAGLDIALQ